MNYRYPFPSINKAKYKNLREEQDYTIWLKSGIDLSEIIKNTTKPIIEIGGPTESGFYFLDTNELPSRPVITNITKHPPSVNDLTSFVDEIIDALHMPYDNCSVGMFLMSGFSTTSDWYTSLSEKERTAKEEQIIKEGDLAMLELEQVAIGILPVESVRYAQRIPAFCEIYRCLTVGGIFMTDGLLAEIKLLQTMGFELLCTTQEILREDNRTGPILCEFMMRKL